jgi:uncharacterized protein (DUF2336 family)
MAAPQSKLNVLVALANEPSGEKRRDLLRQITDSFIADPSLRSRENCAEFDRILSAITVDLELNVRAELARRLAAGASEFGRTARILAFDEIEVARPVLESSRALSEHDLLEVIEGKSQDHMLAVTKRDDITARISDALVDRGEDRVVVSLLSNETAEIGVKTYEKVADRAESSQLLQAPLVRRKGVPLDLLSELYLKAKGDLRQEIIARCQGVSDADLETAFERGRRRILKDYGALPQDYETCRARIEMMNRRGELKSPLLARYLREGKRTEFIFSFATLTGTDYLLVNRLIERKDVDALAILSRAALFDRALFVTIALMIAGQDHRMSHAEEFGQLYQNVTPEAAQKVVRFWQVRNKIADGGGTLRA